MLAEVVVGKLQQRLARLGAGRGALVVAVIAMTVDQAAASARARDAATVVFPVPPLPVTTCSRTPSQSVSRALIIRRLPNGFLVIRGDRCVQAYS